MSQIKTLNGVQYTLPQYNDTGWGANTGNVLTQYMAAIADVTLQLSGGAFTLTAETDFGANFGLKALYLKSETANPASAGNVRLAKTDSIKWRNNANGADIALAIDGSDNLTFSGTKVILSGLIVNADVASGAAIAYSKLALTGSIVNADINASAAIAYSKLSLSASIVNADIAAAAAIAVNKLAALTASRVLVSDGSGFVSASSVTTTTLGFLDATSSIQTQLNATIANPLTSNLAAGAHKITGLANGTAATDAAAFGQIFTGFQAPVFANGTSTTTLTLASFSATVVTASITPTTNTHRIKITATFHVQTANNIGQFAIANGVTNLMGASGGQQVGSATVASLGNSVTLVWIDSPASTSAQTYTVYGQNASASGNVLVGNGKTWSIVLEEIV